MVVTYHEHGMESLRFQEKVGESCKLVHTGYKRQDGTITDALTDKVTDPKKRREKVQARTSGPPKYEDVYDKDSWLFVRFVSLDTLTKAWVDEEVQALQDFLAKAKNVFAATAVPKDYRAQKIRESWCFPYEVVCGNTWAAHGTIHLEPWDTAITNKDIARFTSGPATIFPDESPENIAAAGGFFSPESAYTLNDLGAAAGGLPSFSFG